MHQTGHKAGHTIMEDSTMLHKSKSVIAILLIAVSMLLTGCNDKTFGNPGGDCNGTHVIGHATECVYRVVTGK